MKIMSFIVLVLSSMIVNASEVVDTYKLNISAKVPTIVDNMQSLGKRVYKTQRLVGTLTIKYINDDKPIISITSLTNKSYKIRGKYVTYDCDVDNDFLPSRINYIGNNKTDIFRTPTIVFYVDCDPSYNIGSDEPDNALLLVMSGSGSSRWYSKYNARIPYRLSGKGAGQLGCGCHAYGHKSPTRGAGSSGPTSQVQDIAAASCTFSMKFINRTITE